MSSDEPLGACCSGRRCTTPRAAPAPPCCRAEGCMSEQPMRAGLVAEGVAVKLPAELDPLAFSGELLACAMSAFQRAETAAGQRVAIVGVGFLGALLSKLASNAGAQVLGLSRRPFAQSLARRYGA